MPRDADRKDARVYFGRTCDGGKVHSDRRRIVAKMFAVVFAGQCAPMGSDVASECRCWRTKRGAGTGPLVFSVRCSIN